MTTLDLYLQMSLSWLRFKILRVTGELSISYHVIISLIFNFGCQQSEMGTASSCVFQLHLQSSTTLLVLHFVDVDDTHASLPWGMLVGATSEERYLQVTVWCMLRLITKEFSRIFLHSGGGTFDFCDRRNGISSSCLLIVLVRERLRDHPWLEMRGGYQ